MVVTVNFLHLLASKQGKSQPLTGSRPKPQNVLLSPEKEIEVVCAKGNKNEVLPISCLYCLEKFYNLVDLERQDSITIGQDFKHFYHLKWTLLLNKIEPIILDHL